MSDSRQRFWDSSGLIGVLAFLAVLAVGVWALIIHRPVQVILIPLSIWLVIILLLSAISPYSGRMLNWFAFSVFLALLPILTVVLIQYLRGDTVDWVGLGSSPEIYLFATLIAGATYGEFRDLREAAESSPRVNRFMEVVQILVMAFGLWMFGLVFLQEQLGQPKFIPDNLAIVGIGFGLLSISHSATFRLEYNRSIQ